MAEGECQGIGIDDIAGDRDRGGVSFEEDLFANADREGGAIIVIDVERELGAFGKEPTEVRFEGACPQGDGAEPLDGIVIHGGEGDCDAGLIRRDQDGAGCFEGGGGRASEIDEKGFRGGGVAGDGGE